MEGNTPILENYEQFAFAPNGIKPDLTADNNKFLDGVSAYLKNNPAKKIRITGLFRPSEDGMSDGMFENLGLARANVIKDLLIQRGIDKERLNLDYNRAPEDLSAPINFTVFSDIPTSAEVTDERLTAARYSFDNMVFSDANFESNSANFIPGSAFLNWADSVQVYFQLNPEKTLRIIGHTDKTGPVNYNKDLGLARAVAAKEYFKQKGIQADIKVSSQGEKQPIATNKTKNGRQRNRRVNFIINTK